MLTQEDKTILDEAYKNCKMGLEAINTVISKVYDEELALDLNRQAVKFMSIQDKIIGIMQEEQEHPKEESTMQKAMAWTAIQANTLLNTSTEHLADMMIQGNKKGITDMMKAVKENKGATKMCCEMAEDLMDFEEKNIRKLKSYL